MKALEPTSNATGSRNGGMAGMEPSGKFLHEADAILDNRAWPSMPAPFRCHRRVTWLRYVFPASVACYVSSVPLLRSRGPIPFGGAAFFCASRSAVAQLHDQDRQHQRQRDRVGAN